MTNEEIAWSDQLTRILKDRELRNFWQRFQNQPRRAQDRITPTGHGSYLAAQRPEIRNIIGQSESSFQMADIVMENKILLVKLSGIAKDTATLTETLLINSPWHAVKSTSSDRPTYL